ncbi:MAG: hypothetical protein IPO32_16470 [Crocinitomicaceae bacterium]|nr:hypothetical protein [Crocinitomicaceae bacterium]
MKKYFYLLGILSLTVSCGTATYMYDDVYDVAEGKSLTEDGYTDLIKDNEKDHKVVVDKKDRVTFGGYYPSNNTSTGGTSFSSSNNCNCSCGHYSSANMWRYVQPGWTYGNPNSLWFNSCSCNHWNNNLAYHYNSFGNMYNLYGYYDYWGGWNSYYPIGMDPYGYYASVYGWYPYQWYNNNNNGIFNGNNIVYVNPSGGTNTNDGGNHFYGHRNPSSTSSSNTTVYAHTVKEDYDKPVSSTSLESTTNSITNPFQTTGSSGLTNKPLIHHEETAISSNPFGTSVIKNQRQLINQLNLFQTALGSQQIIQQLFQLRQEIQEEQQQQKSAILQIMLLHRISLKLNIQLVLYHEQGLVKQPEHNKLIQSIRTLVQQNIIRPL